ncbi:molybdate ABC transporter substrate-binding protein [Streptomyces albiaxialis]|uniref:Molybdate ABC transporter substrate-binding protein n=1 Tax=Streptomyces albiaxialis TaxID=329523 RepID=A0ABN2VTP8_9ACTN
MPTEPSRPLPRRRAPRCGTLRAALTASAALAVAAPLLAGCGDDAAGSEGKGGATLRVLAASSLTDVFKAAGKAYEKEHPGTTVKFSFAGSQELAAQVREGVPADVLVTADTKTMKGLSGETAAEPSVIAKNRLTIATAPGNPHHVRSLKDLSKKDLKVVLAASEVPVGRYGQQILDEQHVKVDPVSREVNVRSVLTKVEMGEADAGLVYVTDATVAGDKVGTVRIPDARNAVASYPAAPLKSSKHAKDAAAFSKWLGSPEAQKLLREAGFGKP